MRVELNDQASDMFGAEGPQAGARGDAVWIDVSEDADVLVAVRFDDFSDGLFYVRLDWVVWPSAHSDSKYHSTIHVKDEND